MGTALLALYLLKYNKNKGRNVKLHIYAISF